MSKYARLVLVIANILVLIFQKTEIAQIDFWRFEDVCSDNSCLAFWAVLYFILRKSLVHLILIPHVCRYPALRALLVK